MLERIDSSYVEVQNKYHRLVSATVAAHQGVVVDTEGDGVFSVFEETVKAAEAAVEIQRILGSGPIAAGWTYVSEWVSIPDGPR